MLVVSEIAENLEKFAKSMLKRNIDVSPNLKKILKLDEKRRASQAKLDNILAESNQVAKEIGELFKKGESEKAIALKEKATLLKEDSKKLATNKDSRQKIISNSSGSMIKKSEYTIWFFLFFACYCKI